MSNHFKVNHGTVLQSILESFAVVSRNTHVTKLYFFRKTTQFQCQQNQMNLQFIVTLFFGSSFRRYKPPHHPHNCKLRKCIDQRANDLSLQDTAYMMTFCMKAWRTGKEDLLRKDLGFIYNFPGQVVYG